MLLSPLNHTQSCPLEGIPVHMLELSVKSCSVGPELHPLIWWCFIPSWLLSTKSWNFIKYWDSGLNARHSRTFIATVRIAEVNGWRRSGKKGEGKLSLALNLLHAKLSFMPRWSPVYFVFFLPVFWNLISYVTKQGVLVPSFPVFMDSLIAWEKVCYWVLYMSLVNLQNLGLGLWLGLQQEKKGRLPNETKGI